MATHSNILAWRIPWTEEPGGYSPWGRKESDMTKRLRFVSLTFGCCRQSWALVKAGFQGCTVFSTAGVKIGEASFADL